MITVNFDSLEDMLQFAKKLLAVNTKESVNIEKAKEEVSTATAKEAKTLKESPKETVENADRTTDDVQEETAQKEKVHTLEEVRAKLAALNKAGKRSEVRAILNSFGVEKLSEIPKDKYLEVMEKAGDV